jgi:hypothetical protein
MDPATARRRIALADRILAAKLKDPITPLLQAKSFSETGA